MFIIKNYRLQREEEKKFIKQTRFVFAQPRKV